MIRWVFVLVVLLELQECSITLNKTLPSLIQKVESNIKMYRSATAGRLFSIDSMENELPLGLNSNECHIREGRGEIIELSRLSEHSLSGQSFAFSEKYSILYSVATTSLKAVMYDSTSKILTKVNELSLEGICPKRIALDSTGEVAYISSCKDIRLVKMKTVLLAAQVLVVRSKQWVVQKLFVNEDLLVEIGNSMGVNLYGVQPDYTIVFLQTITQFAGNNITILSGHYRNSKLYLLDSVLGLLIFTRSHNMFKQDSAVTLQIDKNERYEQLAVWSNTLFIGLTVFGKMIVCEMQLQESQLYFVRYYKGYDPIYFIMVLDEKLLIITSTAINALEINRDPRKIKTLSGGVTTSHFNNIHDIVHLAGNKFLLNGLGVSLVALLMKPQTIECVFTAAKEERFKVRVSCMEDTLRVFNSDCIRYEQMLVSVGPAQADSYLWLVLIVLAILIVVIMLLVCWREKKVRVIDQIIQEIMRIKSSRSEHLEFVEEHQENPIVRERHWDEFKERQSSDKDINTIVENIGSDRDNIISDPPNSPF